MPCVGDLEIDVIAGRHTLAAQTAFKVVRFAVGESHGNGNDPAALADGFRSVHDEVHDDLAKLGRVRLDQRYFGCEVVLENDLLADADRKQVAHLLNQLLQIERLDEEAAAPAVGQQLTTKISRTSSRSICKSWFKRWATCFRSASA